MATETMTTTQYAKLRKINRSAVVNAIKREHRLPGVVKFDKPGWEYILHVDRKQVEKFMKKVS